MKEFKKIYGVGINDTGRCSRRTKRDDNGVKVVTWRCPYYSKWVMLLQRCYSNKFKNKWPSYKECTMCAEWLIFSNFIQWVDSQPNKDWKNCELDKDLLIDGNKHYSPETCAFVSEKVNSFLLESTKTRNQYLIGVQFLKSTGKFRARCSNPFNGKLEHIGVFNTELEAHLAWKKRKHEHAVRLSINELDDRVKISLTTRYLV